MLWGLSEGALAALVGLGGGLILGLAARLGRFCTLGAIEDFLYQNSSARLRMWGVAIGVAIIGTQMAALSGAVDSTRTAYLGVAWTPWGSVLGGLMFGYGMALAGNCGFGALARLGGGDLRSFVIVMVTGLSSYIALSGPLAAARVWLFPQVAAASPQGLTYMLGHWSDVAPAAIGLALGFAILGLSAAARPMWQKPGRLFWGAAVGIAVTSGWLGTAWLNDATLDGIPLASHTFSAPIGETILYAMTASGQSLSFGIGSVAGVLAGAFLGSLRLGHFRWEACDDPRELRRQILGAAIMGAGAVIALGCTIGQGVSAFSTLAFSAPVTFAAIFAGAALGLRQLITGFARA